MATTNGYDVNQLDSDSLLPPRKRLLAGFKKQNSNSGNGSSSSPSPPPPLPPCFASSSSTSYSNGSSSASTDVQTHLDNLLTSQINDDHSRRSPEELAQASRATAALAVKLAKAARATANEKAIIASKAVAAAKSALELFASFPAETVKERSLRKNKQKKHVPVQLLYSKEGVVADEDLSRRLHRAINNSPRVLRDCGSGGHRNKKQKSVVTYENHAAVVTSTMYDGLDVAGVVDSDSSNDDEVERSRVNGKLILKERREEESSNSLGRRKGRVKLKKLPLSMCGSKDQENGIMMVNKSPLMEKNVGVSNQQEGSNGGGVVAQVVRS